MSGNKRQRELARAKYERQQARRAKRTDNRRRNQRIVASVVVVALVLGTTAWVVLANSGGDTVADTTASATASPSPASSSAASAAASSGASAAASAIPSSSSDFSSASASAAISAMDCREPGTVRANDMTFTEPGQGSGSTLTLKTNCGDVVIALDPKAPQTVSSMAFLASKGFFDSTQCHRLTTAGIYVLQCGDPAGDGTGGPGYAVMDENLPAEGTNNYPAGTVAMANAGADTGGSQFFIVYGDTTLPAGYSIWGKVTSGLDIVKEVAAQGTADGGEDGSPLQPVFIESATVQ